MRQLQLRTTGQRLAGQVHNSGPDVLAEEEHPEQASPATKVTGTPPSGGLAQRGDVQDVWRDAAELAARADAKLGEDLAQVVLDRTRAEEQPGADLRIRQALAGQPRDLRLLSRQLKYGGDSALTGSFTGGLQLAAGARGERLHTHRLEHLVGGAQLIVRVRAAPLTAQPLPVQQMSADQVNADASPAKADDRLTV
jgi:hypothetical protein